MHTIADLKEMLAEGSERLRRMCGEMDYSWNADLDDSPPRLHNMYVRSLITCYVSKFAQLSQTLLDSLEEQRYLVYALAGRSLIEHAATLRYYALCRYKPLLDRATDKGSLTLDEMKELIAIDDQHLRGSRFDWESFLSRKYQQLKEQAVKQLKDKKERQKHIADGIIAEQVNVLTCIEKWAETTPEVLIAYALFCDLVHPNIGSSFLVASVGEQGIYFKPAKGESLGESIAEQSLPLLLSVTMKPFGQNLAVLMATVLPEE